MQEILFYNVNPQNLTSSRNSSVGGSGQPNFMNPFEYGKSFLGKLFPKRFGTLTETKP